MWNGRAWVAVGDSGVIMTAPPTLDRWSLQPSGYVDANHGVAWDGARWVVDGLGGALLTSTDGVTWAEMADYPLAFQEVRAARHLNDTLILGGLRETAFVGTLAP